MAEKITLTGPQETMLATLYGRAVHSRSTDPLLHDSRAEQAVDSIDYDFSRLGMSPNDGLAVAFRAHRFDRIVEDSLRSNPDVTVLHLGCGLDSRAHRIELPPQTRWYDVDFPDVIELRRRLFPEDHRTIPSSVTDPHLLDEIPSDKPVLVVAEGLTMYLSEQDGHRLLRRIVDHFPSGELVFDTFSHLGVRVSNRWNRPVVASGSRLQWGVDDPRRLTAAVPGLRIDSAQSFMRMPEMNRYPWFTRKLMHAAAHIPALRNFALLVRLRFGPEDS